MKRFVIALLASAFVAGVAQASQSTFASSNVNDYAPNLSANQHRMIKTNPEFGNKVFDVGCNAYLDVQEKQRIQDKNGTHC